MLVSFESVSRKADGHAYARLNLHSPSVTTFHREIAGEFQLKSLNPFMWSKHFPTGQQNIHHKEKKKQLQAGGGVLFELVVAIHIYP